MKKFVPQPLNNLVKMECADFNAKFRPPAAAAGNFR